MMVKKVFALTKKIDKYYNNMRNANIKMPNRLFGMKVRAMLSCAFYGCSFYEYFSYRFWEKTYNQKKDYLLHRNLSSFFDRFNDKNFRDRMGDKSQANAYYGECLKRDFYDLENGEDGFIAFCLKHKNIF